MPRRLNGQIKHAVLIRAPTERCYDAFATAEGLDAWFTTGASVDARVGGPMTWRWRDWGPGRITTEATGTVYEAERPRRFVFDWDSGDDRPTQVEITFEPCAEGTIVRLRELGYSDTARGLGACLDRAAGWGEALTLVKFWLEHGIHY
jgi:uncharacterized protein YndB with AHSA1/START domain